MYKNMIIDYLGFIYIILPVSCWISLSVFKYVASRSDYTSCGAAWERFFFLNNLFQLHPQAPIVQNFDFKIRRDVHRKNFLWGPRVWVGRRHELISGYILKIDGKKIGHVWVKTSMHVTCYNYLAAIRPHEKMDSHSLYFVI